MLIKMNESFVIDFAMIITIYCNQCLALIHLFLTPKQNTYLIRLA